MRSVLFWTAANVLFRLFLSKIMPWMLTYWLLMCNICLLTVKVSPSIGDVAKARFVQGTKLLAEGGPERLFQHIFGVIPEEKYLHSYACYLATPSGPVNGTLYISTKRVAFCSESPLHYSSSPGQSEWLYYKVCSTVLLWML